MWSNGTVALYDVTIVNNNAYGVRRRPSAPCAVRPLTAHTPCGAAPRGRGSAVR